MLTVQEGELLRKKWQDIVAQMVKTLPANAGDMDLILVRKISWRSKWLPTPVLLSGESHGQRSLVDYSPWGRKEGHKWVTNTSEIKKEWRMKRHTSTTTRKASCHPSAEKKEHLKHSRSALFMDLNFCTCSWITFSLWICEFSSSLKRVCDHPDEKPGAFRSFIDMCGASLCCPTSRTPAGVDQNHALTSWFSSQTGNKCLPSSLLRTTKFLCFLLVTSCLLFY